MFSRKDFRPGWEGMETLARRTSVLLVEQVHDLLQILRREPRVDRRRLDVGVTQMLLHRTEVSAGPLLKTRLSERSCVVRSDRLFGRSWSDGLR